MRARRRCIVVLTVGLSGCLAPFPPPPMTEETGTSTTGGLDEASGGDTTTDASSTSSSTGDGGTSSSGDSTGRLSVGEGSTSEASSTSGYDTDPAAGPYAPCPMGDEGCSVGEQCMVVSEGGPTRSATWCALACDEDKACPMPSTGDAPALCDADVGTCALDCSAPGYTCPDGMGCYGLSNGESRCAWPS